MTRTGHGAELAAIAPVGRDEARRAAESELSKDIYHRNDPGPLERALDRVLDWLNELLDRAASAIPGGGPALVLIAVAVVAVTAYVAWRVGPVRRSARSSSAVVEISGRLDAAEHRRRADGFAGEGRYAQAVRERMRSIVRELETRGVLEPRPGRTADEVAREAGALVPVVAPDLRTAATVFDEIWYGGRTGTAQADAALRQADQRIQRAQLVVAGSSAASPGYQVPR